MGWTYSKAGVDLEKHRSMHSYVAKLMMEVNRGLGYIVNGIGGYAATVRYDSSELSIHIDGVGTKTIVLQKLGKLRVAGWDCVAMNVNDVVCEAAKPIAVVDYIAMPRADEEIFREIVEGVADASREAGVAMLGGETAILPDLVNGVDVVCAVLAVKMKRFVNRANVGDIAIGLPSTGIHANGYSLVRKILESRGIDYRSVVEGVDLAEELTKPVAIYSKLVLEAIEKDLVTSVAHITGGAFTKLRRVIGKDTDIVLNMPEPPKIFKLIMRLGDVPVEEMYKVFNMGIGMVLTTKRENLDDLLSLIEKHKFKPVVLGEVVKGVGRVILRTSQGTITL